MASNFKDIFEFKASKIEADKEKILFVIKTELTKFNFEDDYLKEGGLEVISYNEVRFHTCTLENFTDTRSISEANRPNKYNIQVGSRRISEFNSWDYKLSFNKKFENSDDNHSIEESHHAIGCGTCKQHGKIWCSSCRGAGDVTCSSCDGRGEKQCGNCKGTVNIKCWSCSGKGTKETGYGENKKIENCTSCSGRGSNKCTRCSNGYITCSTCSGRRKVTCYTCHGSGEVTCYQCDGYRTMDHYFVVNAKFINLHQNFFVTNPFPGFDNLRANEVGFAIQNKLFEFKENRFKDGYFEQLQSHPLYRQICAFFDFKDSDKTKLISSRITFFENKYFEVSFAFYGESYTIYLDQNLSKSYYGGKKPSDQYELDLLYKSLKSASSNELDIAKKTIQKLSKYDFISINEQDIVAAIDDTQNVYKAKNEIDSRNYSYAESTLRLVSKKKKKEKDYERLIKRLNRIYFTNTIIFWFISLPFLYLAIKFSSSDFNNFNFKNCLVINLLIACGILFISSLLNKRIRNIQYSRILVLLFIVVQSFLLFYYIIRQKAIVIQENEKVKEEIKPFKDIISSKFSELGYYVTDVSYQKKNKIYFWVKYRNSDSIKNGYEYKVGVGPIWGDMTFEISGKINDLRGNEDTRKSTIIKHFDNREASVLYIKLLDFDSRSNTYTYEVPITHMSISGTNRLYWIYKVNITNGDINSMSGPTVIDEAEYNQLAKQNTNHSQIHIGSSYQGGIVIEIDEAGEHGLIMSNEDLGNGNWTHALKLCDNYSNENYDDWRLPTLEELRMIYANKNIVSNFQENWYWSSTEEPDNLEQAYHFGFISGDKMSVPKEHGKFVRAVRNF